jgi:hypothetical protein
MKTAPTKIESQPQTSFPSFDDLDVTLLHWAHGLGCQDLEVTSLIPASELQRAGYPDAFPQLVMYARPGQDEKEALPAYALSPAVCYHAYLRLAGQVLNSLTLLTARGHCFRNESGCEVGRRQIEFRMRELIFVGQPGEVELALDGAEAAVKRLAAEVGIVGSWEVGNDPFFLSTSRGRALMQRLLNTKREFCLPDGLAIASINRHRSFFGERFSIRTADGAFAHSACIAFGLDRWKHALNH